ncbi:MAG: MASE1 domain-containing protein [Nitrococcus mobilis]|nr:MASE1 domain-containing protein [Nitrococcus mobilis]
MQVATPALTLRTNAAEIIAHLGVFGAYFLAVQIGRYFALPQTDFSLVWPVTGLALAVVYLLGRRFVVTVALAAFAAHFVLQRVVLAAAAAGLGAGVAAAVGAWLLHRSGFRPRIEQVGDVLRFVLFGALASSAVSSLVGSAVMYSAGMAPWQSFASLWWMCWVADMMGILLVGPVLTAWAVDPGLAATARLRLEQGALLASVILAGWVVYSDVLPSGLAMSKPLSYCIFPLMIWAAVRCRPKEAALLLLVYAAIAVAYTNTGHGPFAGVALQEDFLSLHAHLGMLSLTTLLLASAMAERRAAEQAVRESEAKYRLMVENQTDLVVKTDRDGYVLFASPTVGETFGETPERLLGKPFRLLVRAADKDHPESPWGRLFAPPWCCYLEQPVQTPNGQRWLAWAAKTVMEENGEPGAVVAVGRDVTERRRAEDESRQYLEELAHVGRVSAMGEMAAGLAHELNQPLCAITTYSQACRRLLGANVAPELVGAMERVAANAQRAGEIIRHMRSFVRKDDPSVGPADINALIKDVLELTSAELRRSRVKVEVRLGRDLPAVAAARIQIHQVLVNLIRNAVEAMGTDAEGARRLLISTALDRGGGVAVVVADTGPGLPVGLLDNIFEPFVTGKTEGLGLGLSISRSIVENHGGRLFAGNRPGGGAEFHFSLPVFSQDQAKAG